MIYWKPTVLLMRPGIGRNPGLAHRARNSCELRVELTVQYIVMFCAIAHSRLNMQPLLPKAAIGLMLLEV